MCEHDHTEDGARIYSPADIVADIVDPERGIHDESSPIVGYVLVAVHEYETGIPPITVIAHKPDSHAVSVMLSLGIMGVNEVQRERDIARDEIAADVDSTFKELAEKMRDPGAGPFPNGYGNPPPGERNYDGN